MKKRFLFAAAAVLLLLALPATAFAQTGTGDQLIFGGSYELESGESLNGSLVVFGGSVTLESDSSVIGDVVIFGGNISMDGQIDGSLVIVGGNATLEGNAVVTGDLITPGGHVTREEGSQVFGQVITNVQMPLDLVVPRVIVPEVPVPDAPRIETPRASIGFNPFWWAIGVLFRTVAFAALAVLLIMFMPTQTKRAASAIVAQPVLAGGIGLLTLVVGVPVFLILAAVVIAILAITIILLPVSLLGVLVTALAVVGLGVAVLYGWITIGMEVGLRLGQLVKRDWPEAVAAGLGTFVLSALALVLGQVGCIGWILPVGLSSLGLGGVILTRFGTQTYPPGTDFAAAAPSGSEIPSPLGSADEQENAPHDPDAGVET